MQVAEATQVAAVQMRQVLATQLKQTLRHGRGSLEAMRQECVSSSYGLLESNLEMDSLSLGP